MDGDVKIISSSFSIPIRIPSTSTPVKPLDIESNERASRKIQLWWKSLKNKRLFSILRTAICCAENSVTHEILRKLIPREAELLHDPTLQPKVRFRLNGDNFPPIIVFKIFMESKSIKYISGKSMIRPSSEASEDARRQMGNRIYFDQMLSDACQHRHLVFTDVIDIATIKDYMKYNSGLDESPAYLGGKENHWRNLTMDVLPRHTQMYNIVEFLTSGRHVSIDKLQSLSMKASPSQEQSKSIRSDSSLRESRKTIAKKRAEKMRMNYTLQNTEIEQDDSRPQSNQLDDADESHGIELYEWTKELSFEELIK